MAAVKNSMEWLGQLKASQLHQLAVALGCACSGSKTTVADGIREALTLTPSDSFRPFGSAASVSEKRSRQLSIVSIDMGIQNLAYAHLLLEPEASNRISKKAQSLGPSKLPVLRAWERLNVFPTQQQDEEPMTKSTKLAAYLPSRYANAAYHFITNMLRQYNPTHILIEQQRFRSGGSSAVAEWTLRVGVFEGMLHAILRTLREERKKESRLRAVISINPARSARFWLEGSQAPPPAGRPAVRKITGREGKQAKIDLVGKSFLDLEGRMVETGGNARVKLMQMAFMQKWSATSKMAKELRAEGTISPTGEDAATAPKQPKLDDLADCLLQALAWLRWQQMRDLVLHDSNTEDALAAVQRRLEELTRG
jgi:cruciform cutting endonuclease 1